MPMRSVWRRLGRSISSRSLDPADVRIRHALIANVVSRAIRVFEQLLLIPLLLAVWGPQLFGEWLALTSIAGFAAVMSFGIGHTAAAEIVLQFARDQRKVATSTFVTSMVLISLTILAGFASLVAVLLLFDVRSMVSISILGTEEARFIAATCSLAVLLNLYCEPLAGVLGAAVGAVAPNTIFAVNKSLEIAAIAAGLALRMTPRSIAIVIAFAAVIHVGSYFFFVRKWAPWLSFSLRNFDTALIRKNWRPATGFFIIFVSVNIVAIHVPRLLVSHILGAASLAAFTVIVTYMKTARSVAAMVPQSMQVELGRCWAQGHQHQARQLIESMIRNSAGVVILLLVLEIVLAPFAIPLWTRGQIDVPWELIFALAAVTLVGTYFDATTLAASAFNRVGRIAIWYAGGLAVEIGVLCLALPATGNVALVGIAMLLPEIGGTWSAFRILRQVVGRFRVSFVRHSNPDQSSVSA